MPRAEGEGVPQVSRCCSLCCWWDGGQGRRGALSVLAHHGGGGNVLCSGSGSGSGPWPRPRQEVNSRQPIVRFPPCPRSGGHGPGIRLLRASFLCVCLPLPALSPTPFLVVGSCVSLDGNPPPPPFAPLLSSFQPPPQRKSDRESSPPPSPSYCTWGGTGSFRTAPASTCLRIAAHLPPQTHTLSLPWRPSPG
jgi:hypothetical protein